MPEPIITEQDRARMRRLGEHIAAANEAALHDHLALPGRERLARSLRLSRRGRGWANVARRDPDEPWKLLERARELGHVQY